MCRISHLQTYGVPENQGPEGPLLPRSPPFARHPQALAIVSRSTGPELKEQGSFVAKHPTRKLAVILHADVVDTTTLVQKDGTLAHERIQDGFRCFCFSKKRGL